MPLNSFSLALSTFTGQNAGAHRKDRIHHGYRAALAIAAVYSLLVFVAGHTCGNVFMHLFVRNEPEVIAYGIRGIAIYSSAVLSLGMIYINRSVLNGIGDTGFALFNGGWRSSDVWALQHCLYQSLALAGRPLVYSHYQLDIDGRGMFCAVSLPVQDDFIN